MGKFILCEGQIAKEPFVFVLTGIKVYTLEELGYYIYHNIETIKVEDFDSRFFQWVALELKREDLVNDWKGLLEKKDGLQELVCRILRSTDYFTKLELESFGKSLEQLSTLLPVRKKKLEADQYLKYQEYVQALPLYQEIIVSDDAAQLSAKEFGNVLHNMAVIHVHNKAFELAEKEFIQAYTLNQNEESLRQYFFLLKLQKKEKDFMHGVLDQDLSEEKVKAYIDALQEYSDAAEQTKDYKKIIELPVLKETGKVGEYYYTIDTMIFKWKQQYKRGMEQG